MCGSLHHWLHKPHVAMLRLHASTQQSSVAVNHYVPILPTTEGWYIESRLSATGIESVSPAHMIKHAWEQQTT